MKIFLRYGIPPLIPLFLSLCAGITAGNYLPVSPRPLLSAAPVLLTLSIILIYFVQGKESNSSCCKMASLLKIPMIKSRSYLSVCLPLLFITLFFASGYYLTQSALYPRLPANHISHFTDKGSLEITGKISSHPEEFLYNRHGRSGVLLPATTNHEGPIINGVSRDFHINRSEQSYKRLRFTLSILNIMEREKDVNLRVTGDIQMSVYTPLVQYKQGDIIKFKGNIKSLRNFNNPGGFDYVRYMHLKKIWGRGSANGNAITLMNGKSAFVKFKNITLYGIKQLDISWDDISMYLLAISKLNDFRSEFATHIFNHTESRDSGAIICALTTGNREFITEELIGAFSKTGGSHILAISGLHLSIVATLFFYLFNTFLLSSQWLLCRGWSRKGAALLTIFPLVGYAVLSGCSDATLRAMIMVIIFMAAAVIEKESNSFNSLAAAGIVILLFDPLSMFTVSFQLSFSAVFFILMGLSLVPEKRVLILDNLQAEALGGSDRYKFGIKSALLRKFINFILVITDLGEQ